MGKVDLASFVERDMPNLLIEADHASDEEVHRWGIGAPSLDRSTRGGCWGPDFDARHSRIFMDSMTPPSNRFAMLRGLDSPAGR